MEKWSSVDSYVSRIERFFSVQIRKGFKVCSRLKNNHLQWGGSSWWSLGPNTAWGSIETTTIRKTEPALHFYFTFVAEPMLNNPFKVYNARMEIEENYQILGLQQELQQQVTLNNLPSNQILELCLQIRKRGSKISDWSECSNKERVRKKFKFP